MFPFNDTRKKIEITLLVLLISAAVIYGMFRAYPLIAGPSISISNLEDGDTVSSTTFTITGTIARANHTTLQGRPMTLDDHGNFTETLVASPPYTILVITATDAYGATTTKTLRVIPK